MTADDENLNLLLQQLHLGSEEAFAEIYDHFSRPLYRTILRMVQDDDIAQELLQDLFLKLWNKRFDLEINKPLKPYLFKIAESLAYSHFRKIAKDQRLISQLIITTIDFVPNPEDAIINKETHELLSQAINTLPAQRKQVFTLCKLEGKSYQEVSDQLGISVKTISDHLVKANKAVKQHFLLNQDVAIVFFVLQTLNHLK
jgi:RNA polymerase sigma-70 factor (family 1)